MAEQIVIPPTTDRRKRYAALYPQVAALLAGEVDAIAAMANLCAAVQQVFGWHWVGFYRVVGQQLVLGPFQGPVACTPIAFGKGVCGTAWKEDRPITLPDVDAFPGHIACSAASRSEIVIPLHGRTGAVAAVLDVDSASLDDFGPEDGRELARLCRLIEPLLP
ncbi:MAG: GAF domain-containing protein [Flavobacteriales bacterium]|nr:GAF domain-containing protein [Flavobacteriales bacterium]MEB2341066.1 GAF domain-containing protein [Flavobacteriia bacterium]